MKNSELKNEIEQVGKQIIEEKNYLCSIDVLLKLNYLSKDDYEKWRFGKVEYLEKLCTVNLKKLSAINQTIVEIAKHWNLKKSWTAYNKYGKGEKKRLRFSKSGNKQIEESYATHYIDIEKIKKKKQEKQESTTKNIVPLPDSTNN